MDGGKFTGTGRQCWNDDTGYPQEGIILRPVAGAMRPHPAALEYKVVEGAAGFFNFQHRFYYGQTILAAAAG
jgi:hypothetical protein